jgi:hypothetical protein
MNSEDNLGRKLIEKYGWRQGLGLGKQNEGISTYVRVSKKRDTSGVGIAKDANTKLWNVAFWENMYNSAVTKCGDKGGDSSSSSDGEEKKDTAIATARASLAFGGMFVSASKTIDDDEEEDIEDLLSTGKKVSDWSSSAKGLYHGRVSGKLERIRKQEEQFVKKPQEDETEEPSEPKKKKDKKDKKDKKERKKRKSRDSDDDEEESEKRKKSKKQKKEKD